MPNRIITQASLYRSLNTVQREVDALSSLAALLPDGDDLQPLLVTLSNSLYSTFEAHFKHSVSALSYLPEVEPSNSEE